MKLFYICPHLSTGGQPQYTLKMLRDVKNDNDVTVIEMNNYSDEYIVQRNKINREAKLVQLYGSERDLISYISANQPDIIHFQELPESFLSNKTLNDIYFIKNRPYNIIVTTHSSLTRPKDFRFVPDRIVAVNEWQRNTLAQGFDKTDVVVWEYPIEDNIPSEVEKIEAKSKLNMDPEKHHVLNVGLFTPGKNQGELFEIARQNPENVYHFVGNQAGNFKEYWEPLMKNKPENCVVWQEREDVETFYKAADEFYFTSKFELNPLVVKEALYYGLPVKMRKLTTYGDFYDDNPLVTYI